MQSDNVVVDDERAAGPPAAVDSRASSETTAALVCAPVSASIARTFAIARAGKYVQTSLVRSSLLERIGEDRLFPSVGEAVTAVLQEDVDSLSKPSDPAGPQTES